MANFTAGPGAISGIDFTNFDIEDLGTGNPTDKTATHYKLEVGANDFTEFFGTGFKYDAGSHLIGGTLTRIVSNEGGQLYDVSGFSMAVATANKFIANKDADGFLATLLAGADTITGSAVADDLLGFNGNDTIDGLGGNDTLNGGAGNDSLIGGAGNDNMDGGAGNDTYDVDSATDLAAESGVGAAGGTDTVRSSAASYALGANIENLVLTGSANIGGSGNALANTLTGNTGANALNDDLGKDKLVGGDGNDTLSAGADNDTLDGGIGNDSLDGGSGNDSMAGGAGNDSYKVDSVTDKVAEALANDKGGGEDTVFSSVTFTLGANLDNLTLLDSTGPINGTGNTLDNELTGNGKDNKLSGLAGADTITGGAGKDFLDGGVGADSMAGGEDNDIYVQDNAGDQIAESGTTDGDELRTNLDTVNSVVAGIEHYTFTGTKAVTFTGDAADNSIIGTVAADKLDGADGNDTVSGLGGNDSLTGGADNDRLIGGMGADALDGGLGDDTYGIDNAGDTIVDAGGTHDTVESTIAIDLTQGKFAQIEDATLLGMAAINLIGSAGANILTGNAGANKIDGGDGADTMDGGKGNDTYFVDSAGDDQVSETFTAAEGGGIDTVISKAGGTLGANIENLTLIEGALVGKGNDLNNVIVGNDGANLLDGGAGIDKMTGGKGDDEYHVDNSKDVVTETLSAAAQGGMDTVISTASFVLGANVENLQLDGDGTIDGTGNALDNMVIGGNDKNNKLSGMAGNDGLAGGAGDDTLDGGTGIDQAAGGTGNDTYVLDNVDDVIFESAGDSSDTVAATFAIDLQNAKYDEIENATLLGAAALTATGDAGNNILTGNSGANTLLGLDGIDTLDGKGGVDSLDGGKGNDVYIADNVGEKIVDSGGDLEDEVRAKISFSLANLATIENAMLLSIAAALNLTGNGFDNVLTGNEFANKIDGGAGTDSVNGGDGNDTLTGGTESDTLAGGEGNDVYIADGGETIVENKDEGIDTVQSALTYSIAAFANVENLILTGTGAIGGTGNDGNNAITGNSGQNTLDGGAGADTMAGGMGNDTYTVDDAGDKVTEAAGGGIDTVLSLLPTYILPANVENLTLTGIGDISGTGNTLANILTGNDGKNVLAGDAGNDTLGGGLGADVLNGGAGADTYLYAAKDVQDAVNTGDKGVDHVTLVGSPFDWDVQREGNDLLIQYIVDQTASDAEFDPNQAIRIVDQYAGADIAFFQGDFGEFNLFYGGNPNLTTVFTPTGLTGKDQGANAEVVEGTTGDDVVNGGGGQSDFLYGNDGKDKINSQSASDEFAFLSGGKGNDTLTGAAGTDAFRGDEGDDSIDGGAGDDRASYRLSADAVAVDLTKQGQAQEVSKSQGSDTLVNIEDLSGSKFNDTLTGDSSNNTLGGLAGNDSLSGGGGFDFLVGNEGNDTLAAASLDDFVEVSYDDAEVGVIVNLTNGLLAGVAAHTAKDGLGGIDSLINIAGVLGGDFGDQFFGSDADEFFEPGGGDDTIDGGSGFDDVDYFSSSDGVTANLNNQGTKQFISASQGFDTFTNIEGLDGSAFNDVLTGDDNGNFLQGRAGADSLQGGDGGDRLRGGAGNDTINGGGGFDQVDYFAATAAVHVDLSKQGIGIAQTISAGEGKDTLLNIEDARGSAFNDTLIGNAGNNNLFGIDGNDSLNGGDGFDFLGGGKGNDIINGGLAGDFDEASFADAEKGAIVNLSAVMQFGVAAGSASDGLGGVDKLVNIGGIFGSEFNDTIIGGNAGEFFEGMRGDDSINGGGGFNALEYFSSEDGVTVNLSQQGIAQDISATQGKDTFIGISDLFGSLFADKLTGDGTENFIFGRDGNDTISGGGGTDALHCDAGNDLVNLVDFSFQLVDGSTDTDVLVANVAGELTAVSNRVFGIEKIDLSGSASTSVFLLPQDVFSMSETHQVIIAGDINDTVRSSTAGWTKAGTQVVDGQTYDVFHAGGGTLLVDQDINDILPP